jgi:arsenate reductase
MPDPAAVVGPQTVQQEAFAEALRLISRRIDLMLALPIEKLERLALESRVRAIGNVETIPETSGNAIAPASASEGTTE